MKDFAHLNYYELLEIPPTASPSEIQKAYEIARKTFSEDSIATYSLIDDMSRRGMLNRIEEAFSVLIDEERRHQYDIQLGLKRQEPPRPDSIPSASEPPEAPRPGCAPYVLGIDLEGQEIHGRFLKEFRIRKGIPLQEIAAKTRINITYLQFIEQDHFKGLPTEVYLRGYLVQYAKVLGLPPDQVAERYLALYHNWKKTTKRD